MSRTKPPSNKVLTIRLPEGDLSHLEEYCLSKGKTKTEVILEMIRRLKIPARTM
ncbi:hypothetical protein [Spirulina subsalsa]|uniref:hypothetical protein n=1 Tax=Spirulina subsalsa TaxID=54311 RepID=UPI00030EAD56|nr:hypothetical protein [Spirulina subsalsa]